MKKYAQTLLGLALLATGIAGWFLLPDRGEIVVMILVGFGAFLISKSTVIEFGKAAIEAFRAVKK